MLDPVVVDTNILFSALLRTSSSFAQQILASGHDFFVCESAVVELFRHKERIVTLSQLSEEEVVRFFHTLLRRVDLFKEDLIAPSAREQAWAYCRDVDEADTPHVALEQGSGLRAPLRVPRQRRLVGARRAVPAVGRAIVPGHDASCPYNYKGIAYEYPPSALALHLDGLLWTGDGRRKRGLRRKGFDRFFDPHG